MRITIALALILWAPQTRAQEIAASHQAAGQWTESWIDRPLVLAPRMMQANLGLDVTNEVVTSMDTATGESMNAAFDIGVAPRVQAGLALTFPINPATFGSAIADVQYGVSEFANLRMDAGVARIGFVGGTFGGMRNIYEFGFGLPIKVKLSQKVAVISGRTSAAGFGRPTALAGDGGGLAAGANPLVAGESLVAVAFDDSGTAVIAANAPIGVLIAPHERVAIALHSGYRYLHEGSSSSIGNSRDLNFVPFGGDLMFNLPQHVDLGVSGDVSGALDQSTGYFDLRQFMAWAQARF
jgi:hypothetical protein